MRIVRPAPDVTRGYMPIKAEVLVRSRGGNAPGDLNESLMIGPVDTDDSAYYTAAEAGRHFAPNLWPERPEGLRAVYERYYRVMDALAIDLMRLFALALGLPEKYFDSSVDRSISRLRVRNYPAPLETPVPGQLRAGAHSDYGSLTILKTEDRPGGLQGPGQGRRLARRAAPAVLLRRQHRRYAGTLDQRPLGLDPAPRGQSAGRADRREPAPVGGVLPEPELRRAGVLPAELHRRGASAEVSADRLGRPPSGEVRGDPAGLCLGR
jgi:hypothetical protein